MENRSPSKTGMLAFLTEKIEMLNGSMKSKQLTFWISILRSGTAQITFLYSVQKPLFSLDLLRLGLCIPCNGLMSWLSHFLVCFEHLVTIKVWIIQSLFPVLKG
jgi:hypothetical protein